jgi:hypothetical protein
VKLRNCVYEATQAEMIYLVRKIRSDALEDAAKIAEESPGGSPIAAKIRERKE